MISGRKKKSQIPFGQRQHVIERRMKVTQASLDCSDTKFGALRGTCLSKPVMRIIFCICSPISVEFTSVFVLNVVTLVHVLIDSLLSKDTRGNL